MASIVTTVGLQKLAAATPIDQLNITQIAVGSGTLPDPLDPSATSLVNQQWIGGASDPIKTDEEPQIVIFEGLVPGNVGGFTMTEIGIFDDDGDLIAIGTLPNIPKPVPASGDQLIARVRLHIKLDSAATVNLIAQDQGTFDHQGATNRDATGAHPAASISIESIPNFDSTPDEVQAVLNLLRTAAKRNIGTGSTDVSDNTQLNTRLATTGNLGDAAQSTRQSSTSDTISDRLMLVGAFGLGSTSLSAQDLNTISVGGLYVGTNPSNSPEAGTPTINVWHIEGFTTDSDSAAQIAMSQATGKLYIRTKATSTTWNAWRNVAEGDSIGKIDYFGRSTAPDGYLSADGSAVSRTTYSQLFDAIGTTFGSGDGSTTFNLPTVANLQTNVPAYIKF